MTPPLPPHRCDPDASRRHTSNAPLRADSGELPRSFALSQHDYAKAAWFLQSLRLPGVPFLGSKWAAIRLGPMTIVEWRDALRDGTVAEVPTLKDPDILIPSLTHPDPEIRGWAFLALGEEAAVPDERLARYLAHPEPERPLLPNTLEGDVQPLSLGRRRWPSRVMHPEEDDAWFREE